MPSLPRRPFQAKPFEALRGSVMAVALAALIALVGGQHAAANASTNTAAASDNGAIQPPAPKKKKSSKPKIYKGSGESTAERDRRLYRECKGRPNAGACEGYAR